MGVIIDTHGHVLQAWFRKNGNIIHDSDNKYDQEFHICIDYTEEQKNRYAAIKQLKKYLEGSDYQAIKFSDGAITEEEYAPIRARRAEPEVISPKATSVAESSTITPELLRPMNAMKSPTPGGMAFLRLSGIAFTMTSRTFVTVNIMKIIPSISTAVSANCQE